MAKSGSGEVSFKDFAKLARVLGWTVNMLAERFHEKIERPADFFERVLSCRWKNSSTGRSEDRCDVAIPYRSVLRFYFSELGLWRQSTGLSNPRASGIGI